MSPTHQWCGVIPGWLIYRAIIIIALAVFAHRAYFLFRLMVLGKPSVRWNEVGQRLRGVLLHVPGQRRLLMDGGAEGLRSEVLHEPLLDLLRPLLQLAEGFRDKETGSLWNLLGHAVKGPMAGKRLRAIPHVDAFWFAWAAFHPSTTIYTGP